MGSSLKNKDVVYHGEYFFITEQIMESRKTPIYYVYDNNAVHIATIKWYSAWRKFCFYPETGTIWDNKCLLDIISITFNINYQYQNQNKLNNSEEKENNG